MRMFSLFLDDEYLRGRHITRSAGRQSFARQCAAAHQIRYACAARDVEKSP
jgi:hypothetical protein